MDGKGGFWEGFAFVLKGLHTADSAPFPLILILNTAYRLELESLSNNHKTTGSRMKSSPVDGQRDEKNLGSS